MNVCTVTVNATTICTTCTGQPAIPARAARFVEVPNLGWNGGANSVLRLDGNLSATWTALAGTAGAVVGFANDPRADVTDVASITHGWHAFTVNGALFAQVFESGHARGTASLIDNTNVLRVDRVDGAVTFLLDDVLQYTSTAPSAGPQLVGAALYAPGDGVDNETFTGVGDLSQATGSGRLVLRGFGVDTAVYGSGRVRLAGTGTDYGSLPTAPNVSVGTGSLQLAGSGFATALGSGTGQIRLSAFGTDADAYASGTLHIGGNGNDQLPDDGFTLLMGPGYLSTMIGSAIRLPIIEEMVLSSPVSGQPIWYLEDGVRLNAPIDSVLTGINRLRDSVSMMDSMSVIWRLLLEDGVVMGDTPANSLRASMRLVENLMLLAGPGSTLTATHAIASTLAMADSIHRIYSAQVTDGVVLGDQLNRIEHASILDGVVLTDALNNALTHRIAIMEELLLKDTADRSVLFTCSIVESLNLGDSLTSVLEGLSKISDGILLTATFSIDNGVYTAWVCHTTNRAFTQYENYPFNSFAELGGEYLGCAPDGIYELVGNDDDGEPITGRIRTALDNLGTGRMKRMPSMYLGYSSSGTVALKVITTSDTGDKEENWYKLTEKPADATREGRIKLGRGMKSVYWQFELISVAGASFALDELQLFPLILDRRT